ncbi:hypothetical protein D8B26_002118 [Coccidioides posadasii str. Silveira]|uniref:Uncharacterized protein n=1 Tax=Coccidioides posadasii (strain C735) TaxID=222929 RepID=C5PHF3_COCP7|nr:hypothetical protein CPC735_053260 [Coccidioides posadasii C735 delta SOWgp]EER23956.1 hypothetical protein CPC735_053260 [Coccidioides posadasii C735 delta SOWgp]QVM07419.1 hypothetical protein D8B26_002118 [Coccidioides posadasii str. Silveira]|eukprot:XP_003066101.1 hypothetical protein CPC735_053260 [Coccidioides posadasii C735 delta SOWgp]
MAFRVPNQVRQRQPSFQNVSPRPAPPAINVTPSNHNPREEESQEWVLFSPELAPSTTTRTHTTSTDRTPRTTGRSRLSDFGSLGTALHSGTVDGDLDAEHDDLLDEDGTELDSLDDGLHAFREPTACEPATDEPQLHHSDPALLPTHDGLGTFTAVNLHVQEQLWQHEQFNPRRRGETRPRRRSSVQRHLDSVDEVENQDMERERWQRIEQWRMEQSRALLQEIERETRRRRYSRANRLSRATQGSARQPSSVAVESTPEIQPVADEATPRPSPEGSQKGSEEEESFWRRITRKVIRDLIGIDNSILAVIFGEALAEGSEEENKQRQSEDPHNQQSESTAAASKSSIRVESERPKVLDDMLKNATSTSSGDNIWQQRLLDRIARELGILVHQLCEHPGAFTTYVRPGSSTSSDFAGKLASRASSLPSQRRPIPSRAASYGSGNNGTSEISPIFNPTLQDNTGPNHASLWGIEEEESLSANEIRPSTNNNLAGHLRPPFPQPEQDIEYWERELDIGEVFRYLCKGLAGKVPFSNDGTSTPKPLSPNGQGDHGASNRAAIIRHHHPLVARADAHARSNRPPLRHWQTSSSGTGLRASRIDTPATTSHHASSSSTPILFRHFRRPSSSCASQSTLVSSTKGPLGSGSSRHYWDIGGSVGSGSAIVTVGGASGMGSWGDV